MSAHATSGPHLGGTVPNVVRSYNTLGESERNAGGASGGRSFRSSLLFAETPGESNTGATGIVRGILLRHGPFTDGAAMVHLARVATGLAAAVATMASLGVQAPASRTSGQRDLPNPYRLVENWPTLPPGMNGGRWGELIRA